jgi:hypothetical protein
MMQHCYVVIERVDEDTHSPVHVFMDKGTADYATNQLKLSSIRAFPTQKLVGRFDAIGYQFNERGLTAAIEILGRHVPASLKYNHSIDTKQQQAEAAPLLIAALQLCSDLETREVGDFLGITKSYYQQTVPITLDNNVGTSNYK